MHKPISWFDERCDCVDPKESTLELICTYLSQANSWGRIIVSHPLSLRVSEFHLRTRNIQKTKNNKKKQQNGPNWTNIHILAFHSALPPVYSQQNSGNSTSRPLVTPLSFSWAALETPRRAIDRRCHLW